MNVGIGRNRDNDIDIKRHFTVGSRWMICCAGGLPTLLKNNVPFVVAKHDESGTIVKGGGFPW